MSQKPFRERLSRRRFLSGAAGFVLVSAGASGVEQRPQQSAGFVIASELERCAACERLGGHVLERYNGRVPVLCRCSRPGAVTSMSSTRDDELVWTPTTYHLGPDGRRWHTPYFMGMRLS